MSRSPIAVVLLLGLVACAARRDARTVESMLGESGFRMVPADTPDERARLAGLPSRRLTMVIRAGQTYYYYADPSGCGCMYLGDQDAYTRYDALAHDRDIRASQAADRKAERKVASGEDTTDDPWAWRELTPEAYPR